MAATSITVVLCITYVHDYVFIYYYYYPALGALNISFYQEALYHRHSIITIQFSHININIIDPLLSSFQYNQVVNVC